MSASNYLLVAYECEKCRSASSKILKPMVNNQLTSVYAKSLGFKLENFKCKTCFQNSFLDFFPRVLASVICLFFFLPKIKVFLQFLLKCKFYPKGAEHQRDIKKYHTANKQER